MFNVKKMVVMGLGAFCAACLCACNINVNVQNSESESVSEIVSSVPEGSAGVSEIVSSVPEGSAGVSESETKVSDEPENYDNAKALIKEYLENSDKTLLSELSNQKVRLDVTPNVEGTWSRTDVHSSHSADFDISSVTDEGFKYSAEAYYFLNTGMIEEQDAYWVSDNAAISEFTLWEGDEDIKYVLFIWDGTKLNIATSASSGEFGLGMNVYLFGEYIQGTPSYTNANVLHETFSDEMLQKLEAELSSEDYEDFIFITENGAVEESDEDGSINGYVPTFGGYGYHIYLNDGKMEGISFEGGNEYLFTTGAN